jgi:hypothetical protein
MNDATRLLGGTLGVAVIGSVYASLYARRLTSLLPAGLSSAAARAAHASVGTALGAAQNLGQTGQPVRGAALHEAATAAFFHGFHAANYLAAGVALAGAVMALVFLPAHPMPSPGDDTPDLSVAAVPHAVNVGS